MTTTELWPIAMDTLTAISKHYHPVMDKAAMASGIERGTWGLMLAVLSHEPVTVTNELLQVRVPYQEYSKRLEEAAKQGVLEVVGEGEYRLSEQGNEISQQVILAAYARMESLDPMRSPELHYLATILCKLVKASMEAPEPTSKWCLSHSRRFDPGENASLLIRVDQYLSDLSAFRDDAHLSAWQPLGFNGPAWESLTLIWREEVETLESLHTLLSHRRYPRTVYTDATHDLESRGLIKKTGELFQITVEGIKIRKQAEELTDRYFYAPWTCLEEDDLQALRNLLICLSEGLQ